MRSATSSNPARRTTSSRGEHESGARSVTSIRAEPHTIGASCPHPLGMTPPIRPLARFPYISAILMILRSKPTRSQKSAAHPLLLGGYMKKLLLAALCLALVACVVGDSGSTPGDDGSGSGRGSG